MDAITYLVDECGADPNLISDPLDATPLELAENNKKSEMVDFLKSIGGTTIIPLDSPAHTSLSQLVHKGDKTAILESFKSKEMDKYGRTDLLKEIVPLEISINPTKNNALRCFIPLLKAMMRPALI